MIVQHTKVLSVENFNEYFDYSSDGEIVWKVNKGQRGKRGNKAGYKQGRYLAVKLNRITYLVHHVVWYLHHGFLPDYSQDQVIDHIDGNPVNNKIENLRLVATHENQQNVKVRRDNSSGVKGVHFCNRYNKWKARISFKGNRIDLGYFQSIEEAKSARMKAEESLHRCRRQGFTEDAPTYDGVVGGKL